MIEAVRVFEEASGKSFELNFVPTAALEAQRTTASDPLQISFATLMHDIAIGNLRGNPREAVDCFGLRLTTLEEYAKRAVR
jgi:hypothetical protein